MPTDYSDDRLVNMIFIGASSALIMLMILPLRRPSIPDKNGKHGC